MKKLVILLAVVLNAAFANSQEKTQAIYGKAVTMGDMPVRGLSVSSKTLGSKTTTDTTGCFTLVCAEKDVIIFEGELFKTVKKKIKPNTTDSVIAEMTFPMTEANIDVAIGYGYITEKDRTTAVSRLPKGKDYCRYTNMMDLLSENFTSLSVSGGCVTIRGNETFNGPQCALLIVDGQEVQSLDFVTPCDVKDVSVIKDGGAAIYGSRGGNGVIIITLKKAGD